MIEYKPPHAVEYPNLNVFSVFLGGSIEMGKAENWQEKIVDYFSNGFEQLVFFNPRRDDWDASWIQDPSPGTQFNEQVTWELVQQEMADLKVYYFAPGTVSPISLLELGLYHDHNTVVCCPPEFQRYGNVKMVCQRYGILMLEDLNSLILHIENEYKARVTPSAHDILCVRMDPENNEAKADRVREYLVSLLLKLWEDPEGFSGKRPWGNSGWHYELYYALGEAGMVPCKVTIDEDGFKDVDMDREAMSKADKLIEDAIRSLW